MESTCTETIPIQIIHILNKVPKSAAFPLDINVSLQCDFKKHFCDAMSKCHMFEQNVV